MRAADRLTGRGQAAEAAATVYARNAAGELVPADQAAGGAAAAGGGDAGVTSDAGGGLGGRETLRGYLT